MTGGSRGCEIGLQKRAGGTVGERGSKGWDARLGVLMEGSGCPPWRGSSGGGYGSLSEGSMMWIFHPPPFLHLLKRDVLKKWSCSLPSGGLLPPHTENRALKESLWLMSDGQFCSSDSLPQFSMQSYCYSHWHLAIQNRSQLHTIEATHRFTLLLIWQIKICIILWINEQFN